MKKTICLFLAIICCFTITSCGAFHEVPFSDDTGAIQTASNSVIMLSCYDKAGDLYATGSAFAAFEEGVFVTNCHVIEDEVYFIKAQMETGLEFNITSVVTYDEERDLAILRTDAETGLNPLPLGKSVDLEKGEKVIAIGSPLGLINTISVGLYSGTIKEEQEFLQFSAAISHGSSGGALFNNKGEVIGITSASFSEGQNLNLAIPIEEAVELWEKRDNSAELSIPEFYELWDHIPLFSVSYILSHKAEFNGGIIIKTEGFVFIDPYSKRQNQYYLVESPSDYSDICEALEELKSYGGALSQSDYMRAEFGSSDGKIDENLAKHYEVQLNYESLLEKTAFTVNSRNQTGTVAEGEYVLLQGETVSITGIPHLINVSVLWKP